MFPENIQNYLINEDIEFDQTNSYQFTGKTFLYDFETGDFVYKNGAPVEVTGKDALKVWIEKVIRTEKFRFKIYDNVDYPIKIEDLIGSTLPYGFIESEFKRELSEAILRNPFIKNLINWNFEREGSKWRIDFEVVTDEETFGMEVAT